MAPSDATAVVTGAGGGIGSAVVERLRADGQRVAAIDARAEGLAKLPAGVERIVADVSDEALVDELVAPLFEASAGVLVNCVGLLGTGDIEEVEPADWERVIAVNLTAVYLLCRAAVPHMRRRGRGRIVNFASVGGQAPALDGGPHYSAAKAGVIGFTRTLARRISPDGITANVVSPGRIDTPMFREAHGQPEDLVGTVPLGRIGVPADIAAAVAYLVSDEAAFVTGATLDVNGGALMR